MYRLWRTKEKKEQRIDGADIKKRKPENQWDRIGENNLQGDHPDLNKLT